MSMIAIKAACEPLRIAAFPNILSTYTAFGTRFSHPISWLKIDNHTDATLAYSINGIDDHFTLVTKGFLVWDIGSNRALSNGLFLPENTQIYVRQYGSVTYGETYLSVAYGTEY